LDLKDTTTTKVHSALEAVGGELIQKTAAALGARIAWFRRTNHRDDKDSKMPKLILDSSAAVVR
jgi:hypothetical protein